MSVAELLPLVRALPTHDKLRLIRILAEDVDRSWDDEGELREGVVQDLLRISAERRAGKRGTSLDMVVQELGLG